MSTFDRTKFYIDGGWVEPATTSTLEVIDPFTEQRIATVPEGREADIDRAVDAARRAFDTGPWPRLSPAERAAAVSRLADCYAARIPEMADVITAEMGCTISFSREIQAPGPVAMLQYFAGISGTYQWEEQRAGLFGDDLLVRRTPVGVVGVIAPWNVPQLVILSRVAPALVAGCTIVIKPAPETPLDSYLFAEIVDEAGLPPGVINIVAAGREVGEHLVTHPDVDKIGFTGSTVAGKRVASLCGANLKRCTTELGGKSAAIILDDANLDIVQPGMKFLGFMLNGQSCLNHSRVLVSRKRHDEVVDMLVDLARGLVVGDPTDTGTDLGPLFAARHRERVEGYVAVGREEGAQIATGGGRPAGFDVGYFVEPTIFTGVDNKMRIAQEEIFGPVVAVIPFDDVEDAARIADDSTYGLAGSVWTSDPELGLEVARKVRTGTFGINGYSMDFAGPIGGFKQSGIGREMGPEGLGGYVEIQTVMPLR
jgi:betaine-aldehyde dehydrogenase